MILYFPRPSLLYLRTQSNFTHGELEIGVLHNLVKVYRSVTPLDDSARVISRTILQRRPAVKVYLVAF